MADNVLPVFLEAIFQGILPATIKLILDELCLPDEVKKELESLTTDVSMLQAYLRDAVQKQQTNEFIGLWLSKLQDVVYDANDLLDECELEGQRQKSDKLEDENGRYQEAKPCLWATARAREAAYHQQSELLT
ncbi:hypothetical protein M5K25_022112 [Dendrobium thyrsiflorum]|uniref:Disease resistance N-terminal domain-containing protein n=1 Tax=Dendrobium thyrsiflorum TaxID=117978 RepID=A0ABD0U5J0_DENTH